MAAVFIPLLIVVALAAITALIAYYGWRVYLDWRNSRRVTDLTRLQTRLIRARLRGNYGEALEIIELAIDYIERTGMDKDSRFPNEARYFLEYFEFYKKLVKFEKEEDVVAKREFARDLIEFIDAKRYNTEPYVGLREQLQEALRER